MSEVATPQPEPDIPLEQPPEEPDEAETEDDDSDG